MAEAQDGKITFESSLYGTFFVMAAILAIQNTTYYAKKQKNSKNYRENTPVLWRNAYFQSIRFPSFLISVHL